MSITHWQCPHCLKPVPFGETCPRHEPAPFATRERTYARRRGVKVHPQQTSMLAKADPYDDR